MNTIYRAEINGFYFTGSVEEIKKEWDVVKSNFGHAFKKGDKMKLYKSESSVCFYCGANAKPVKVMSI